MKNKLMTRRSSLWMVLVVCSGVSGYCIGHFHDYSVQRQLIVLRLALTSLGADTTEPFAYALVDELDMVRSLRQQGAVVETAVCLGQLHSSSNQHCRFAATILLMELDGGAAIALPFLEEIASNKTLPEKVRKDAADAIEGILEKLCSRRANRADSPQAM